MASTDDLRVGDSEREAVAAELREHYAQGRLTLEEFQRRLDAAMAARTRGDLDRLIADLPHARPPGTPLPASGGWRAHGHGGHFGTGSYRERRRAIGRIATLLAAVTSLLIVFVVLAGISISAPGRLGVFVVLFAIIRRVLRWLFGFLRRRF